ncbi:ADP-ribosyltransferase [Actinomadura sp. HBU206391]|uniref:ADP-ribosyltransferase n=1 Tax=Actinomadura sp. HBU206391 TaxID=2731692 RepID=UPI00164FD229|nr:ADP-ribosyltransferase [Actinomadura sp. HBU206391]MBC6459903.1 hypothetical protein [Actinomadura sp. HBU206391]
MINFAHTYGVGHRRTSVTGAALFVSGSASEMPSSARAIRVLLYAAAGLTAMVALQAWIIVGGVYGFGVAMVFAAPAVACAVAARRMSRPGQWLWWAVLALELFYLLWQLGRLPGGDPFALLGLAFPVAILVLIVRPRTREWLAPVGWRELPGELRAGAIALRGRMRRDRGEGTVSYLAIVLAIATVVGVLATSSVPVSVAGGIESALCRVGGASCDPPPSAGPAARPVPSAAGRPSGPTTGSVPEGSVPEGSVPEGSVPEGPAPEGPAPSAVVRQPEQVLEPPPSGVANTPVPQWTQKEQFSISAPRDDQKFIPSEDYDAPLSCWDWLQGTCDLGQGIWIGGVDALYGARDAANMLTCSAYIGCGAARFGETWDGWRRLVTSNPIDTVKSAWDDATKDIVNDWTRDQPWRSVGRTAPAVLSTIFGGKGLNRLKNLPGRRSVPVVPVLPPTAAADALAQARHWLLNGIPGASEQAARRAADLLAKAKEGYPAGSPELRQIENDATQADRIARLAVELDSIGALKPSQTELLRRYGVNLEILKPGDPKWDSIPHTQYDADRNTLVVRQEYGWRSESEDFRSFVKQELPELVKKRALLRQTVTDWDGLRAWQDGAVKFSSDQDYQKWVNEHLTPQADRLSTRQKQALDNYRYDSEYKPINDHLRGMGGITRARENDIANIDAAMKRSTIPSDIIVTRQVGVDAFDRPVSQLENTVQQENGFISVTTLKNPALYLHMMRNPVDKAQLYLRAPSGTHGVHLSGIPNREGAVEHGTDIELVLDRGQKYRIDKVINEDGQWKLFGTIIP